jgi:hypothetical protein
MVIAVDADSGIVVVVRAGTVDAGVAVEAGVAAEAGVAVGVPAGATDEQPARNTAVRINRRAGAAHLDAPPFMRAEPNASMCRLGWPRSAERAALVSSSRRSPSPTDDRRLDGL